jgi:drug/metabolite transporter (DMT)-like permease
MTELSLAKTVLYGVLAAISLNLGRGLQKYGVLSITHPRRIFREKGYPWLFFVWCLGTGGMVASTFLTFAACAYGPVTIVAALSGIGLIALALFSAFVLKEPIGRRELQAIGLILFGTVLAGYFEGWERIANYGLPAPPGASIAISHLALFSLAIVALSFGLAAYSIRRNYRAFGAIFGGISGICGGISVFYQKAALIYCGCTDIFADIPAAVRNPYFYLFIVSGLMDFFVMQYALSKAKAVTVVPSYQSFYIAVPIVGGLAAYFERVNLIQIAGIVLLFRGVTILSSYLGRDSNEAAEAAPAEATST